MPKKRKVKAFKFRYLLLAISLGMLGALAAILIGLSVRKGYQIPWVNIFSSITIFVVLSGVTYQQSSKGREPDNNSDSDLDPSPTPIKPKPFNPPPFESVREVEEGNYVSMARGIIAKSTLKTVIKPVYPTSIPYQVRAMVNGDERLALRLYEGVANRYQGKGEQWVWGKVESDLERDRR
jgi:hypothetical protein